MLCLDQTLVVNPDPVILLQVFAMLPNWHHCPPPPMVNQSGLELSRIHYAPLAKCLHQWGPLTLA